MPRGTLTPSTHPFWPTALRFSRGLLAGLAGFAFLSFSELSAAESPPQYQPATPLPIWPDLAPGEATRRPGQLQPFRAHEKPPVIRVEKITHPLLDVFLPEESPSGAGVLILPGGGFGKVVTNKEGTEAATWLNELGIAAFVLSYRTISPNESRAWYRPLQDSQRALRLIRSRAQEWGLDPEKIGLLGFSAGGQVAAIHLANQYQATYSPLDPWIPFPPIRTLPCSSIPGIRWMALDPACAPSFNSAEHPHLPSLSTLTTTDHPPLAPSRSTPLSSSARSPQPFTSIRTAAMVTECVPYRDPPSARGRIVPLPGSVHADWPALPKRTSHPAPRAGPPKNHPDHLENAGLGLVQKPQKEIEVPRIVP